jgi:hypothetical protein
MWEVDEGKASACYLTLSSTTPASTRSRTITASGNGSESITGSVLDLAIRIDGDDLPYLGLAGSRRCLFEPFQAPSEGFRNHPSLPPSH